MNNIRVDFTISDLENFSGIKAHTLRIWEKRYGLLTPNRTSGNQRTYDLDNLLKLLNIKVLYDAGHKISKIGAYSEDDLPRLVKELLFESKDIPAALEYFKISMLNFDQALFEQTYRELSNELSFRRIFMDVFIPLLDQIGTLWQAKSIKPAHEHFISSLIQQKILSNVERVQMVGAEKREGVFALYLPMHEIHDLGMLFLHYELTLRGYKSIYLGQSVPLDDLEDLKVLFEKVTFVTYVTVSPPNEALPAYLKKIQTQVLDRGTTDEFWFCGRKSEGTAEKVNHPNFKAFRGLSEILGELDSKLK